MKVSFITQSKIPLEDCMLLLFGTTNPNAIGNIIDSKLKEKHKYNNSIKK